MLGHRNPVFSRFWSENEAFDCAGNQFVNPEEHVCGVRKACFAGVRHFYLGTSICLGESEKYVEINNVWNGVFLRPEMQVLSVQVETTEFRVQYYQY